MRKQNALLKGTIILTVTGLLTRFIGFFYKIYLSNTLGAEKLGIYQLIFPIYGICFTVFAVGLQTAISQMVASELGQMHMNYKKRLRKILVTGILSSLSLSFLLFLLVNQYADLIAQTILNEPDCAGSLRVLSYAFPFCGVTASINGFYYGLKKAGIPAFTQLIEQIVRVIFVLIIAVYMGKGNISITCEFAVLGVVVGEIASTLFNVFSLRFSRSGLFDKQMVKAPSNKWKKTPSVFGVLVKLSLPLTFTRLITSLLHSLEAILIPSMLKKYGMSSSEALSIYGVLTGMVMPFILFPSTITNSLAVLLLPTVSEAHSVNNYSKIKRSTEISIKYSLIIGIFSTGIFMVFGDALGSTFFHDSTAGTFLVIISWLCPFLYLSTTLGSIINGLGKTHLTFFNTIIGLSIRILFIIFLIPSKGTTGYLIGLLVSQLAIALLDYMAVKQSTPIQIYSWDWIVIPSACMFVFGYITKYTYNLLTVHTDASAIMLLLLCCFILCLIFFGALYLFRIINKRDLH